MRRFGVVAMGILLATGLRAQQVLTHTKMDLEDLAPLGLPSFVGATPRSPLAQTPEGATARFMSCAVLTNSFQVPGDSTTVVGTTLSGGFATNLPIGFSPHASNLKFTLINGLSVDKIFDIDATQPPATITVYTYHVPANGSVQVSIPLSDVAALTINPSFFPISAFRFFVDDLEYDFEAMDTGTFVFALPSSNQERVLIHKYGTDGYPTPLQTADREVRVDGFVRNATGQPLPGRTVHFRLIDPPDPAAYVVQAGDSHIGDNVDGPGSLNGNGTTATAVSGADGKVSVVLRVTDHVAGDNYQIETSLNAAFNCGSSACPKSATYTAWKRVYVEVNKMFRRGASLRKSAAVGAKEFEVQDIRGLPTPPFQVRLLHAEPANAPQALFYTTEIVAIDKIEPLAGMFANPRPGILRMKPTDPGITHPYAGPESQFNVLRPYLADALGVVAGSRAETFLLVDATLVNATFAEAFTEHVWMTDSQPTTDTDLLPTQPRIAFDGVLPRLDLQNDNEEAWVTLKWLQHATRNGFNRTADPNHQALFIGSTKPEKLGDTDAKSGFNDTWLFMNAMSSKVAREGVVHELGHQWRLNPPSTISGGHCDTLFGFEQKMYNHPQLLCSMTDGQALSGNANSTERDDGIVGFHYILTLAGPDSEYLRIRRRDEPVPQNDPPARLPLQ